MPPAPRTRWPKRAKLGFAGHAKATDRLVRKRATKLAAKLGDVRDEQRDAFMAATGLDAIGKAGPGDSGSNGQPVNPDDFLTLEQAKAIRDAFAQLDRAAYGDVLYDDLSALVHVTYGDAADLLDVRGAFDVPPTWALARVREAADHVASLIDERDRAALTSVLDDALTNGLSAADTATNLRDAFNTVRTVAEDGAVRETPADSWFAMVARTELQSAAVSGQHDLYTAAGVQQVRIQCANPCDFCAQYDDQVFAIDEVPEGGPPWHPNCSPAGTMIVTERGLRAIENIRVGDRVLTHRQRFRAVLALSRTQVVEDLIELRVGPRVLRVTGNHPVRTRDGWAPASTLQPGDEIAAVDAKPELGAALKAHQVPAECDKCGRLSFIRSDLLRRPAVPLSAVELDRKESIGQGNVDAHLSECEVGDRVEPGVPQRFEDDLLVARFDSALQRLGAHREIPGRALHTPNGIMRGVGDRGAPGGSELLKTQPVRSRPSAPLKAEASQSVQNRNTAMGSADLHGQRENALTVGDVSAVDNTDFVIAEGAAGHPGGSARVAGTTLPHIAIVSLSGTGRSPFSGTVYNFAVEGDESYIAEGVVVHNCACIEVPADEDLGDWRGTEADRANARTGNNGADEE